MKTEVNVSESNRIRQNSMQAWLLAIRPRTLAAGSVPVLTASALAFHDGAFLWRPALLCLLFALLAQIASNLANDYFDFHHASDNSDMRLGPARAVASGWISPQVMLRAVVAVVALAALFGLGLVFYGGWQMIIVGFVCIIALLAYSSGPFPLSRNGLGDLFVLVFFGWVATMFTYYVQTGLFTMNSFVAGTAIGLGAVNILILNNYRDYPTDLSEGKRTTVVLFGLPFGRIAYLSLGAVATILGIWLLRDAHALALLPLTYLPLHVITWRGMCRTQGATLNRFLGLTSRNLLLLGVLISSGLIASA